MEENTWPVLLKTVKVIKDKEVWGTLTAKKEHDY